MYAMSTRTGSVVIKRKADNLEEAIDFFSKMKQLPKDKFLKIFSVTEV
jgi:hypothetical protein